MLRRSCGILSHSASALSNKNSLIRDCHRQVSFKAIFTGLSELLLGWKARNGDPQAQYNYATKLRLNRNPKYLQYYALAADQGHGPSQFRLGIHYATQDNPSALNEAIKYFQLAAQQDHPVALRTLGYYRLIGCGLRQNTRESIKYLKAAAKLGDLSAQYTLTVYYYNLGRYDRAIGCALAKENSQFPLAQYLRAQSYWQIYCANQIRSSAMPSTHLKKFISIMVLAADQNFLPAQEQVVQLLCQYAFVYWVITPEQLNHYASNLASVGNPWGHLGLGFYNWSNPSLAAYYFKKAAIHIAEADWYLFRVLVPEAQHDSQVEEAVYYLKRAADRNVLEACDYLSQCYFFGSYVPPSSINGLIYGFKAGEAVSSYVLASIGAQYFGSDDNAIVVDYNVAAHYMKASASLNNPNGHYGTAYCYLYGYGVPQDYLQAVLHLEAAAEQNESTSILVLARSYQVSNPGLYMSLLRRASDCGSSEAQYEVGNNLLSGKFGEKNTEEGFKYLHDAAKSGSTEYQLYFADYCSNPEHPEYSMELASDYYFTAAVNGNSEAAFKLAELIEDGKLDGFDTPESELYYWAASAGHADAQLALGLLYLKGGKVARDDHLAMHYISQAAQQGLRSAQYHLGLLYSQGIGVDKSTSQSENLFDLAFEPIYEPVDEARYMI